MSFASSIQDGIVHYTPPLYEAGVKNSYSYFSMKFYSISKLQLVGVQVCLEENAGAEYRAEQQNKVMFEIMAGKAAIDNFQQQLLQLSSKETGLATLYGRQFQHPSVDTAKLSM